MKQEFLDPASDRSFTVFFARSRPVPLAGRQYFLLRATLHTGLGLVSLQYGAMQLAGSGG